MINLGEIGVFGWYCDRDIEDSSGITMPYVAEPDSAFRYAVRANDPDFPPSDYLLSHCRLAERIVSRFSVDMLIFEKKGDGIIDQKEKADDIENPPEIDENVNRKTGYSPVYRKE
jgi:hypothetical protein